MQHIILKTDIEKSKMDALLSLLKSWGIEVELKKSVPNVKRTKTVFSLAAGIWKDNDISGDDLRKQAWTRK